MEIDRIKEIREYLKIYVNDLGFYLVSQIKSMVRITFIIIQLITIITFVILVLIFKSNQQVINYIALISNIVVWSCLALPLIICHFITKIKKKNEFRFKTCYQYLDDLFENKYSVKKDNGGEN